MTTEGSTLREHVRAAATDLTAAGVRSAEADAVALAAHVLGCAPGEVRRQMILGAGVAPEFTSGFGDLVRERANRIPLQHLTGVAHFRRLTLSVGPGVFVPRPETEVVAQAAIDAALLSGQQPLVVDLCTGSGAIALAVQDEVLHARVVAVELDPLAMAWAVRNRDRTGLPIELVEADATSALPDLTGQVDVVVSNPPYIPTGMVPQDPEVREHDPEIALYGGSEDGLLIPLAVADHAAVLLRPGGWFVMEHADTHGDVLPERLRRRGHWSEVTAHRDLTGRPRFVTARRV
ncbi:MAG: peptide chain release factor N(5)-glutamine methyltransferase [Actinomycetia bacterium]|nr:peptide chain release factor N(5)-glutamine methyltransferase [Actinomycetes bacterium]